MKSRYPKLLPLLMVLFCHLHVVGQSLSGQWTGGFITSNDLWGGKTEYVLELEVKGNKVEGYSYTYFIIAGKRHYVICRLSGSFDKGSKSVVVSEVEKVKSNTPPDFRDLFQTHMLTYLRQGDREVLQGKWKPYLSKEPKQGGETNLERKALAKVRTTQPSPPITQQRSGTSAQNRDEKSVKAQPGPVAQSKPVSPSSRTPVQTPGKQPSTFGTREKVGDDRTVQKPQTRTEVVNTPPAGPLPSKTPSPDAAAANGKADQRSKKLVELIEVDEPVFKVELYDNGQVDGDTISLFFNNRLMVSRKRLSTTPITLELRLDKDLGDNELVMFAENMGSIPPNTALMVVTVRDKRYEVNITSTEQSNGAVRFRLKE